MADTPDGDLIAALDELKSRMYEEVRLRDSGYDPEKYRALRKALTQHSELSKQLPEWLRRGASLREAVSLIRSEAGEEAGKWQRRDEIVSRGLNPLIDLLEGSGVTFSGNFEIGEFIGRGGFGEVYRCRHKLLNLDFALKLLNPSVFSDQADHAMERFFREARILFSLNHSHIVRIFDVGLAGRRPYIQMELLEGPTLREHLQTNGVINPADARHIVADLASALSHAHARGVIHRDLKPQNVKFRDECPILLDFGLGVFVEDELISRITRTGEAPAGGIYTAPELLRDPRLLDAKTDVYSLGVMWFEMLTGGHPTGVGTRERLEELEGLLDGEIELLLSCLSQLQRRPSSEQLKEALERLR